MLYTDYVYFFQIAGLVLLVAMIGAIVLTLRQRAGRQAPGHRGADRRARQATAIEVRKVPFAAGRLRSDA